MTGHGPISFGIKTTPLGVTYREILQLWQEADAAPDIEHAWLWDHLQPMHGESSMPVMESWTLLAALAGQTERLHLGVLVTNNLIRPPAVLAKIAATTDVISNGRLVLGLGAGGSLGPESRAFGLEEPSVSQRIERLEEACAIIKGLWTGQGPLEFRGSHYQLSGARCAPGPIQTPHPPILIGGVGEQKLLRTAAAHADIWNAPGPPYMTAADYLRKSLVLDQHSAAIHRDPARITRSVQIHADLGRPSVTRSHVAAFVEAGARHIIVAVPGPYTPGTIDRLVEAIIAPSCDGLGSAA